MSEQAGDLNDPPLTVPEVLEVMKLVAPGFVELMQSIKNLPNSL